IGLFFNLNNRASTPEQEIVFTQFKLNSNAAHLGQYHDHILIGELDYNTVTDGPLISTGYGHYRIHWLKEKQLSYETFTQVQYDQGRGMDVRYLFGGGLRFAVIDRKKTSLHLGAGGMFERERWQIPEEDPVVTRIKNLPKSSNYLSFRREISNTTNINMITYYQVGYDSEDNVFRNRLSGEVNLILAISKKFNFNATFNYFYDEDPIVDITKFVYEISNGIQFKL
ncbi:MAG: DUF481 domain-containing protein, partial [Cyclobacteriaceae bacterium]